MTKIPFLHPVTTMSHDQFYFVTTNTSNSSFNFNKSAKFVPEFCEIAI